MNDKTTVPRSVMVTGATGFVGRHIVRNLLARGITPVCLVRSPSKLQSQYPREAAKRIKTVVGDLWDLGALAEAASQSRAVIHLVGIIIARPLRGQTFHRVHVKGTQNVIEAARGAGIQRFIHMSALGTRPNAISKYHRTKWDAEEIVRSSNLAWTIFRPSVIHGPDGEFMRLMKAFACGFVPPVIPYFGSGRSRIQPVLVNDVARCFVQSLYDDHTEGKVYSLGGPHAYTWIEFYKACRKLIPDAKKRKSLVSQPVPLAKLAALMTTLVLGPAEAIVPRLGLFRFDRGQVQMSQEDSICDPTLAERAFGIKMASFDDELEEYADQIQ
ncbi:MAG: complex I NDUFA9 subunit family protein [Planctomycetes bacterium]|nr:complex I NDUFA9 subunit family protein [Planctomycetota bacterium]MBI3832983.1 complex I NDUFA9 subunit family protein [Planctomycetota bacterium]